jgi:hypothetical protein
LHSSDFFQSLTKKNLAAPIGLRLPTDSLARIDRMAERINSNRCAVTRALIERGLESLEAV